MMEEPIESRFIFIGNLLCLDFVNTEIMRDGQRTDLLASPTDLRQWLTEMELLAGEIVDEARLLHEARRLRTLTRSVAERLSREETISDEIVSEINPWLRRQHGYAQIRWQDGKWDRGFELEVPDDLELLAPLVESLVALVCDADPNLVRQCDNPACILFFYDTTKNHGRHWCRMQTCGNRMKAAAHYRRTKEQNI